MSFAIRVSRETWESHQRAVRDAVGAAVALSGAVESSVPQGQPIRGLGAGGGLVPVAKGNGYGVGNSRLATQVESLGLGALAVGTPAEALAMLDCFSGTILILAAHEPRDSLGQSVRADLLAHAERDRLIFTVASHDGMVDILAAASSRQPIRVVLEGLTSMHRFGLGEAEMASLLSEPAVADGLRAGRVLLEGLALHLPMTQPSLEQMVRLPGQEQPAPVVLGTGRVQEVVGWALQWPELLGAVASTTEGSGTLWVSHLDDSELKAVRGVLPQVPLNVRIGTRLWLGGKALSAHGTVLAVHEAHSAGYFQRELPRGGAVVVVGGGTSHGVALSAPRVTSSLRARVAAFGGGALEAAGRPRAPFHLSDGQQTWFHEPPHMHVSLLRLSRGEPRPAVGDLLACDIRLTTVQPDSVVFSD